MALALGPLLAVSGCASTGEADVAVATIATVVTGPATGPTRPATTTAAPAAEATTTAAPATTATPPTPPVTTPATPPPPATQPATTPATPPTTPPTTVAAFDSSVAPLPADLRARMTGVTWRPGCPVGLDDLRLVTLRHWGFDGSVSTGVLVVRADLAESVVGAFAALFDARFPIERMQLVDDFGGDDNLSMAANNTSAFNCRPIDGSGGRWSQHAYGAAIDVNPVQNPWVRGDQVDPPAGAAYLDRADVRPGMVVEGGVVVTTFDALGWGWGGRYRNAKDYQHLSASGG